MSLPPLETELPPEALRVLAQSERLTTPSGDGDMVWHAWGQGEPLVLLHGGGGSWTHWLRNVEALAAAGRRVLAPDMPGCGDSAPPPGGGQDADSIMPVLSAGMRQLIGEAPCDVAGFSFGGLVSGLLAAAHPGQVKRLVLLGAPGLGLRTQRKPLAPWRVADPAVAAAAHARNLANWMLSRPESIDELAIALHGANLRRDRMQKRKLSLTPIMREKLPSLRCRLDAIYGEEESLYREGLARLPELLKGAPGFGELVLIPQAGHWVQFEQAGRVNEELVRLLAD
jgi:pimeloyl-ACP methyl ester carboxylesterase